jgi:pyruvoyl-dependent arginine decarboxylase (PvlArgDC)
VNTPAPAPNGRTIAGMARATAVLDDHPELPPVTVTTNPTGQVTFFISAIDTTDEPTRRAAVDTIAAAVGIAAPDDAGQEYRARSNAWRVSTLIERPACPWCGGET